MSPRIRSTRRDSRGLRRTTHRLPSDTSGSAALERVWLAPSPMRRSVPRPVAPGLPFLRLRTAQISSVSHRSLTVAPWLISGTTRIGADDCVPPRAAKPSHGRGVAQAAQSSTVGGPRGGAGLGTSVGRPRCWRICCVLADASSVATKRSRPPHPGHARTSIANTRRIRSAQRQPRPMPVVDPPLGWSGRVEATVPGGGTTSDRHAAGTRALRDRARDARAAAAPARL